MSWVTFLVSRHRLSTWEPWAEMVSSLRSTGLGRTELHAADFFYAAQLSFFVPDNFSHVFAELLNYLNLKRVLNATLSVFAFRQIAVLYPRQTPSLFQLSFLSGYKWCLDIHLWVYSATDTLKRSLENANHQGMKCLFR